MAAMRRDHSRGRQLRWRDASGCGGSQPHAYRTQEYRKNLPHNITRGTVFNDGTQFDSSYDRGENRRNASAVQARMIRGFDAAVADNGSWSEH